MTDQDHLHHLDLTIFAASSGMKLTHLQTAWNASITIDGKTLSVMGPRPHLATSQLYRKVIDRHYDRANPDHRKH